MQHIETVTVGSGGAASITFSAIPDTYTDLVIKISGRSSAGSSFQGVLIRPNGQSTNLSNRYLYGSGTSVASGAQTDGFLANIPSSGLTSNTFGSLECYIPNYRSSVAKSMSADGVSEANQAEAYQVITAQLWNSTAAITSLTFELQSAANFVEFSSASLYGITAGSDGIVAVS